MTLGLALRGHRLDGTGAFRCWCAPAIQRFGRGWVVGHHLTGQQEIDV